jgi:hypothetical protein
VKSQVRRLRHEDEAWEADFRALPQAITPSATHSLGLVVTQPHGVVGMCFCVRDAAADG